MMIGTQNNNIHKIKYKQDISTMTDLGKICGVISIDVIMIIYYHVYSDQNSSN